jgi:hypothetical protein
MLAVLAGMVCYLAAYVALRAAGFIQIYDGIGLGLNGHAASFFKANESGTVRSYLGSELVMYAFWPCWQADMRWIKWWHVDLRDAFRNAATDPTSWGRRSSQRLRTGGAVIFSPLASAQDSRFGQPTAISDPNRTRQATPGSRCASISTILARRACAGRSGKPHGYAGQHSQIEQ